MSSVIYYKLKHSNQKYVMEFEGQFILVEYIKKRIISEHCNRSDILLFDNLDNKYNDNTIITKNTTVYAVRIPRI